MPTFWRVFIINGCWILSKAFSASIEMIIWFFSFNLHLDFLVGRTVSGGVFWGVCDLIMILGRLSAHGWGCIPVLLVVWHRVSRTVACWSLSGARSWRWDGDLWEIFTIWYYVEKGGLWWTNVLNSALPPQRHRPDAWPEHQDPVIHVAQNKREKKRK